MRKLGGFFKKHPRLTYAIFLIVFVVVGLEVGLRFMLNFNPSYYTGHKEKKPGAVIEYPYGTIRFNSDGFPDDEFLTIKTKPRVAYLGDSVCYGVGAGAGYRVSELLEKEQPDYEHMNMSKGLGTGIGKHTTESVLRYQSKYEIDTFIYLMNLNDILPDKPIVKRKSVQWRKKFDWLRGRSYLFTYLRLAIKNHYAREGIGSTNQLTYEMYPSEYDRPYKETCDRIKALNQKLTDRGVKLIVVILPYEMQVSSDAEKVYRDAGIKWDDDFIDQGPQKKLIAYLPGLTVINAYEAFVSPESKRDRSTIRVGEVFVYNEGDKLDWNHPNRKGHQLIADFLRQRNVLEEVK